MGKHKMWVLKTGDGMDPISGTGGSALVHSKKDLDRRKAEAKKAGVRITVEEYKGE
jgi:hypothetical protein